MTTTDDTTTPTAAPEAMVLTHPFTSAGMGPAPFRFVGACSIPSPTLAEHNPTAYMNGMAMLPRHLKNGCGTCAHCGMAIMNIFMVRNAAGDEYGVGCDCILKVGDAKLVPAVKVAKQRMERAKRQARSAAKREAREAARAAAKAAFEASPEGIAAAAAKAAEEKAAAEAKAKRVAELAPLAERLRDGRGGFCDSIAADLADGRYLRGKAADIATDILAKQCGRGNSKAYWAEREAVWPVITGEQHAEA